MPAKKLVTASKISITLTVDVLAAVKLLAAHEDRTFSNMVGVLLKEALKSRGTPVIPLAEWVRRNIQIKEIREEMRAQVPRFFNLQDFVDKFKTLPGWDLADESLMKRALQDEVRAYYKKFPTAVPEIPKARFLFDEEHFALEVSLYPKRG